MVRELSGDELLMLPVRLHGLRLGRPVDLLLEVESRRTLGLEVRGGDGSHRFLPLTAAAVRGDEIAIRSPLVLLGEDQLRFYRSRAFALGSLRGSPVEVAGRQRGVLHDVVVTPSGRLVAVIIDAGGSSERATLDGTVRFVPKRKRRPAA
jgi:hypothetical protein